MAARLEQVIAAIAIEQGQRDTHYRINIPGTQGVVLLILKQPSLTDDLIPQVVQRVCHRGYSLGPGGNSYLPMLIALSLID